MTLTCEHIEQRLTDYLDRLLTPAERTAFEAHLGTCVRCAPLVERVGGFVVQMHRLAPVDPPAHLVRTILEGTLGPAEAKPTGWRSLLRWIAPVAQPRFAMSAVTLAITLTIVTQVLGIQWTQIEMKDLHPVALYQSADRKANILLGRSVKFFNDLWIVYQIQTRLRPDSDAEPEAAPAPPAGQQEAPGKQPTKRNRELNRANELRPLPSYLASVMPALPDTTSLSTSLSSGRSLR